MAVAGHSHPTLMSINDTKAGMKGLNKEKIDAIIYEASKDSPFFKFQQKRQERIDRQNAGYISKRAALTQDEIDKAQREMDERAKEYREIGKDLAHLICHLDMDMFFAAVEIRDQPELHDKPVAVGSTGMIATSNYVAREYGVRAGMAGFIGKKLCPNLILIKPKFSKYREASQKVMSIIAQYDPNMRSGSLDEAYFDLTDYVLEEFTEKNQKEGEPPLEPYTTVDGCIILKPEVWDKAEQVLSEIRRKIYEETDLTCSAGLTHNYMLSKICSDLNKPNGQCILRSTSPAIVDEFVRKTPVRKIPNIGPVSHQHLAALGISTCQHLYDNRAIIKLLFNPASVEFYLRASLGIASTTVEPIDKRDRKSLGAESSFKATRDPTHLITKLKSLSQEVSEDLKQRNLSGRVIVLRVKWETFQSFVRNRSIPSPTNDLDVIFDTVKELLDIELNLEREKKIRLLGVRVAGLNNEHKEVASSSTSDAPDSNGNVAISSLFPFLNKSIKESTTWKLTYDSGEIDTNADPTDSDIYEDEEAQSSAHVCLTCNALFDYKEQLQCHMNDASHSGLPDGLDEDVEMIDLTDRSISAAAPSVNCPICGTAFSRESQVDDHIDSCPSHS